MPDIFAAPAMQAGLAMTVLLVVIAGAIWLLGRLRDYTTQDHQAPQEGFVNLEEMLRKGDISEAEFRKIQTSARSPVVSSSSTQSQAVRSPEPPADSSDGDLEPADFTRDMRTSKTSGQQVSDPPIPNPVSDSPSQR